MRDNGLVVAIERLSSGDLTTLATDRGQVPMNIGAVLTIGPEPGEVVETLRRRVAGIRRFRQRLLRRGSAPVDRCGWTTRRSMSLRVRRLETDDVMEAAARLVCTPLPKDRPLWTLRWVEVCRTGGSQSCWLCTMSGRRHGRAGGSGVAGRWDAGGCSCVICAVATRRELRADALRRRVAGLGTLRASGGRRWPGAGDGPVRAAPGLAERSSLLQPPVIVGPCDWSGCRCGSCWTWPMCTVRR